MNDVIAKTATTPSTMRHIDLNFLHTDSLYSMSANLSVIDI